MWPFCSARLACSKIAQCYLYAFTFCTELGGLPRAMKNMSEFEAEVDSEVIERCTLQLAPGGLHKPDYRSPVAHFVVGQLRYSHFFRLRSSRLFPRILYSI
jgi:hypothetical protein